MGEPGHGTGHRELARLLADGPFADALRCAIRERGLGLQRIQQRLRRHGVPVSLATLSYWQSGRSRPERKSSLVALARLEEVLELPAGSLAALLPPPRRRGRWLNEISGPARLCAFWPRPELVEEAVRAVDARWDERLTRISQHDRVTVGPDRGERCFTSRQVLRAEADGPDRWVVIAHVDEHDRPLPEVRPLRRCRLGEVIAKPDRGLLVAELLFDHPLRRGETIITEHEVTNRPPYPLATNYERKFRFPVREYVLEVCFDAAAVPARCLCHAYRDDGTADIHETTLDGTNSVHGVALGFGPGRYGFRWDWPAPVTS